MLITDDKRRILQFSDGKQITVYDGFIGISPELNIVTGYDNYFDFPGEPDNFYNEDLTQQERNELAEYMLHLWQQYKQRYGCK